MMKGGYQSKMKDRVQYPTDKKKKQQQPVEDKKKEVIPDNDQNIINGAKINGSLENGHGSQNSLSDESHQGLCQLLNLSAKVVLLKLVERVAKNVYPQSKFI